jgi:hypothetical protein
MRMLLWKMQLDALVEGIVAGKEHDFSNTQKKGGMRYIEFLGRPEEGIQERDLRGFSERRVSG